MTLEHALRDGIHHFRLTGEIHHGDDDELIAAVVAHLDGRGRKLIIEMTDVPYISSTGLAALVRVTAQANLQESRVILAAPSNFVAGVLTNTRLDRFFEVAPTVAEAQRRLAAH